jgi:mRNA interferase RelE/StbE
MNYNIFILRRAQKELSELPTEAYERVRDNIFALAEYPRPPSCVKLTNREGWRIRIGDYRVIYDIDDKQRIITVLAIGHRRDIYR